MARPDVDPMLEAKRDAAHRALAELRDGMRVGLGTGSTTRLFVKALAQAVQEGGLRLERLVTTSIATAALAQSLGLTVDANPEAAAPLDVDVDGADAFDRTGSLLKGYGGALLREKCVAMAAARFVALVDPSKERPRLTPPLRVPVEVVPFAWRDTQDRIAHAGLGEARLRRAAGVDSPPFVTDGQHYILDVEVPAAATNLHAWSQAVKSLVGVVEHGLFLVPECFAPGSVTLVIGHGDGGAEVFTPDHASS